MKNLIKSKKIVPALIIILLVVGLFAIRYECNKPVNKAKRVVSEMSIDEKIGQTLMLALRQWENVDSSEELQNITVLNDDIRSIIGDYHLGGVDLFLENCTDAKQVVHLTYDMQHAAIDDGNLPLLIAADQEGGNVMRAQFATAFSGNMALGASGDTSNAYTAGEIIGKELAALGINCNFGPVVDVNSNEKNPIIGVRSFSGDVDVVSQMGCAMANGFESSGIVNCAKHFPGHGDTATDSHTGLPVVKKSYDEWIKIDGAPFKAIIENGNTDMIMTAHIQYPGLDDTKVYSPVTKKKTIVPATMSKTILTDILKEELGFEGVVISDAMEMDAIDEQFGVNDAVIRAIDAGTDMILMPVTLNSSNDTKKLDRLIADIKDAVNDGRLTEERITDAAVHIVSLKIKKGIADMDYGFDPDEAASNALNVVGCQEHRDVERNIASKCIDVDYAGEFRRFTPRASDRIVCVMPREAETFSAEHAISKMKKEGKLPDANTEYYNYEESWNQIGADGKPQLGELSDDLIKAVENADYLIMGYFQMTDSLVDADHPRNIAFEEIVKHAYTDNIAIIWEYLPYGTKKYSEEYPCFVIYNSVGIQQEDIGKDTYTGRYGPAIPACIEMMF